MFLDALSYYKISSIQSKRVTEDWYIQITNQAVVVKPRVQVGLPWTSVQQPCRDPDYCWK